MKLISYKTLLLVVVTFALKAEGSNQISFSNIEELESGNLKIIFNLEKVSLVNSYALDDPSRIVIDLKNTSIREPIQSSFFSPIKLIRASEVGNTSRVVIDLKGSVYWKKPWQIKYKDRVDLILEIKRDRKISNNLRDIVIAIDAGHGGKDPGAVGKNILEKDITLLIARELERTLKNTKGYKPVMIRSDDRFVNLNDRYQNARKLGADLFVSIHADGFRLSSVKGASVYVWSEEASSITAETLSKDKLSSSPEVKSKIGKLDVRDFDEDAARTLYQIAYEAKIDNSIILAKKILDQLKKDPYTKMHKPNVEFADFRVLKSIDIPSVLVESGFISNPDDAKRLAGKPGRRMIARSIFLGIHNYFKEKPKPNTFMTALPKFVEYEIQKGDVISEIAIRFGVTIEDVIKWNNLSNKSIYPGQVIQIFI
ncbi:MAG: N-acetylmuramoyl-L-alanine amidase [Gammaproteobacteria bacterium]|nr:N-acetylmuramoyl-L-alanine amidase [Gammaproteobacteria bacterium]